MNTQVNRTPLAVSAWLHLQRAREAVNMAAAELPRTQLSPQARQQYALELAELMGKVELLLSMLRRQASNDPRVRRRTSKRLASGLRLGLALRAVHDPRKISVDLAVAVAPNGTARGESPGNAEQDIQITAFR
jgi:hypothetical protein